MNVRLRLLLIAVLLTKAPVGRAQGITPPSDPSDDLTRNWTSERTFDGNGNVVEESKQFADGLGRSTQSQVKNLTARQVFARQTIYNSAGVPVLTTLPAPIHNQEFKYKEDFITHGGAVYGPLNFEGPKANQPDPVDGAVTPGTLGYYYSERNALEPYTPVTSYPYTLTEPFADPIGGVKRSADAGDEVRMGQGREASTRTMPLLDDLVHYAAARGQFISSSSANYIRQGRKSITIDGEGREAISFISKDGHVLATCLSGPQYPATQITGSVDSNPSNWQGYPTYQDIHVTAGTQRLAFTVGGTVRIVNLKTGEVVVDNFAITPSSTVGTLAPVLAPGYYRIVSLTGAQWFTYDAHYGNFTYTYYNDAGQPIAQVPPKGINLASNGPLTFVTRTTYSSTGLPLSLQNEDEGLTEYVYARDGRIRFSQNARQRAANAFSYVNYDQLNHVVESGEFTMGGGSAVVFENQLTENPQANSVLQPALLESRTRDQPLLSPWCRSQIHSAWYDTPFQDPELNGRQQEFLLGAVAKTQNSQGTTWYSYDEMGRVTWMVQKLRGVGVKTVDYTYDVSGKIIEITYQKNQPDAFSHYYEYDADQRLFKVYTGTPTNRVLQAHYLYYLHGPLKRMEIANRLQGVDYLYTLQGSLKSINHVNASLDPGRDAPAANGIPKDLFGLTLDYYSGDYRSAALPTAITPGLPPVNGQPRPMRYDGMVRDAAWRTASGPERHQMVYSYNQKGELSQSEYGKLAITGDVYQFVPDPARALEEGNLEYDDNGNITRLRRTARDGSVTDNFAYDYPAASNRLASVHAPGAAASDPSGLEYEYDAIGQMVHQRDGQQHRYLRYDAAGQVTDIFRDAQGQRRLVAFAYDDRGFRCKKTSYDAAGSETLLTYYVRDALGNVLATYEENPLTGQPLQRTEVPVYGAGRIGTLVGTEDARYELTDQRGDARVVFHRPVTHIITENMELDLQQNLSAAFTYTDTYRYPSDHAHGGAFVARLDGSGEKRAAPMVHSRSVSKGDTITFSAWGLLTKEFPPYYRAVGPAVLLGGLGTQLPGTLPGENRRQTKPGRLLNGVGVGISFGLGPSKAAATVKKEPTVDSQAWIKYRLLDEQGRELEQRTQYMPASVQRWHQLRLAVRVRQGATIELSAGTGEASGYTYFDDLSVEHTGGMIVEEQHQHAYGAPLPGLSYTVDGKRYRHGYQGQFAEKDQETGWNNFEYRNYDARIGRWLSPDAIKRIGSPYTGMGNNPIAFGDADGRDIIVLNYTNGAGGFGHMALLIGSEETGWRLYSKNGTNWFFGYSGPAPKEGSRANQTGEYYKTLDAFYDANAALEEAPQYDRAVRIKTTAVEDIAVGKRALAIVKAPYHVLYSSCQSVIQDALGELDIGFFRGSGARGSATPNANFTALATQLHHLNAGPEFSKNILAVGLGRPRSSTNVSSLIRSGIQAALLAKGVKIIRINPKFRSYSYYFY